MGNKKTTIEDVNIALNAKEVNSKIEVDEKGTIEIVKNRIVTPLGKEIFMFSGKKLNRQISVVHNGKNIVFEKGTKWEDIDSIYKTENSVINWQKEFFE